MTNITSSTFEVKINCTFVAKNPGYAYGSSSENADDKFWMTVEL